MGLTASNSDYDNQIFSIFTDFGTPAAGGIPARPGISGIQELGGRRSFDRYGSDATGDAACHGHAPTRWARSRHEFRRFESIAFDQYGYFSQSVALTSATSTSTGGTAITTFTAAQCAAELRRELVRQRPGVGPVRDGDAAGAPADNARSWCRSKARESSAWRPTERAVSIPIIDGGNTTGGSNDFGGRIVRVLPNGTLNTFAYGFDTSGAQDSSSFVNSMLVDQFLGGWHDPVRLGRPGDLAVQDDCRLGRARRAERWWA